MGSLSLAEADESAALAGVVAKASAMATTAPAKRSQRPVCRRLHPFTDSPSLESSTICRAARSGSATSRWRDQRTIQFGCPVQP